MAGFGRRHKQVIILHDAVDFSQSIVELGSFYLTSLGRTSIKQWYILEVGKIVFLCVVTAYAVHCKFHFKNSTPMLQRLFIEFFGSTRQALPQAIILLV